MTSSRIAFFWPSACAVLVLAAGCGGRADVKSEQRGRGELSPLANDAGAPELRDDSADSGADAESTGTDEEPNGDPGSAAVPPEAPATDEPIAAADAVPATDPVSAPSAGAVGIVGIDTERGEVTLSDGSVVAVDPNTGQALLPDGTVVAIDRDTGVVTVAPAPAPVMDPSVVIVDTVGMPTEVPPPDPYATPVAEPGYGSAGVSVGVAVGAPRPIGVSSSGEDVPFPTGSTDLQPLPPAVAGSGLTDALTELEAGEQAIAEQLCTCQEQQYSDEYNYGISLEDCVQWRFGNSEPPPVTVCINDILTSTSVGDASVLCRLDAQRELDRCLTAVGCDEDRYWRCENNYWDDTYECPAYPYDLDAKINLECWGYKSPPPMVCDDGTRIHQYYVCNGVNDCAGGEDENEEYCPTYYDNPGYYGDYDDYERTECPDGSNSFSSYDVCDGWESCADGYDESVEACEAAGIEVFACADGRGVPVDWACDGVPDCEAGEDEASCP